MKLLEKKKVRIGKVKKTKDGEWTVPVYVDGKFNDDMTYYAGEGAEAKKDAEGTRDQIIKDMKKSKEYDLEEEAVKEENIIVLEKEVVINQDSRKIILEKGDKVQILKEDETLTWKEFKNRSLLHNSLSEFVLEVFYQKIKFDGVNSKVELVSGMLKITPARGNTLLITPENSDIVTIYEDFNYGFKIQLNALGAVFYGYY